MKKYAVQFASLLLRWSDDTYIKYINKMMNGIVVSTNSQLYTGRY